MERSLFLSSNFLKYYSVESTLVLTILIQSVAIDRSWYNFVDNYEFFLYIDFNCYFHFLLLWLSDVFSDGYYQYYYSWTNFFFLQNVYKNNSQKFVIKWNVEFQEIVHQLPIMISGIWLNQCFFLLYLLYSVFNLITISKKNTNNVKYSVSLYTRILYNVI